MKLASWSTRTVVGVCALTLSLALSACGVNNGGGSADLKTPAPNGQSASSSATVTVERCGKSVEYKTNPQKILATSPGITDTLFNLGLGDKIIGVGATSEGEPDPKFADQYQKIAKLGENDFGSKEQVLSTGADFVYSEHSTWAFDASQGRASLDDLEKAGMQIYFSNQGCDHWGGPITGLYDDITALGKIFNIEDNADKLVADLKARVQTAADKIKDKKLKVAILGFDPAGNNMAAIGTSYTQGQMLKELGQENVFAELAGDKAYVSVSVEAVVNANPDIIFVGATGEELSKKKLEMAADKFKDTTAGKHGAFYALDDLGGQPGSVREIGQLEFIADQIAKQN